MAAYAIGQTKMVECHISPSRRIMAIGTLTRIVVNRGSGGVAISAVGKTSVIENSSSPAIEGMTIDTLT